MEGERKAACMHKTDGKLILNGCPHPRSREEGSGWGRLRGGLGDGTEPRLSGKWLEGKNKMETKAQLVMLSWTVRGS